MPFTPKDIARQAIDNRLESARWTPHDNDQFNRNASDVVAALDFSTANGLDALAGRTDGRASW